MKVPFVNLWNLIHYDVHLRHVADETLELRERINCNFYHFLHLSVYLSFIAYKNDVWYAEDIENNSVIETSIFFLSWLNPLGVKNENLFEPRQLVLLFDVN